MIVLKIGKYCIILRRNYKTLFLFILSNGKTVNEELIFISLEKCIESRQINREAI